MCFSGGLSLRRESLRLGSWAGQRVWALAYGHCNNVWPALKSGCCFPSCQALPAMCMGPSSGAGGGGVVGKGEAGEAGGRNKNWNAHQITKYPPNYPMTKLPRCYGMLLCVGKSSQSVTPSPFHPGFHNHHTQGHNE